MSLLHNLISCGKELVPNVLDGLMLKMDDQYYRWFIIHHKLY